LRKKYFGFPSSDISFDTELASKVITELKRDKAADIEGFSNEHLIFSHPILPVIFQDIFYGRPLSVSGRPCYILPMFLFIYLFIFLWPPYSPALVNGGSRKFYTWWTLSVIREVTTWIYKASLQMSSSSCLPLDMLLSVIRSKRAHLCQ